MTRKLLPALYRLSAQGFMAERCLIVGVGRDTKKTDETFRAMAREAINAAGLAATGEPGHWCDHCLHYQPIGAYAPDDFAALAARIGKLEQDNGLSGNRVFYLALPPKTLRKLSAGELKTRLTV